MTMWRKVYLVIKLIEADWAVDANDCLNTMAEDWVRAATRRTSHLRARATAFSAATRHTTPCLHAPPQVWVHVFPSHSGACALCV